MDVSKIISHVRKGSPLVTVVEIIKGLFDDKSASERTYIEIRIVLDELLMQGYRFESPQIQAVVAILKELPAAGARTINFERLYLKDEYTLRKLPKHPRDIPFGHWH